MSAAKAVLFIQQSDGRVSADEFFVRDDIGLDPFHQAKALWESVELDFPGAIHAIHANDEAHQLKTIARMKAMGFVP